MTIRIYLSNDKGTLISEFSDIVSDPFNLYDVIDLKVNQYTEKSVTNTSKINEQLYIDENAEMQKYQNKKIWLHDRYKKIQINTGKPNAVIIEYIAQITD